MGKDTTLKVDDDLAKEIREDSVREGRSFASQVEHYLKIGRAISRSPDYRNQRVEDALMGRMEVAEIDVGDLTLEEQDVFFATFAEVMQRPGASHEYWQQRRNAGGGVGLDANGNLIRSTPGGGVEAYA